MQFNGTTGEYIYLNTIDHHTCGVLQKRLKNSLTVLWFQDDNNQLLIDGVATHFNKNDIVFLTEFHTVIPKHIGNIKMLVFNRAFYCILDHDHEVSCKGLLFFGASHTPTIQIPKDDLRKFEILWDMFVLEVNSNDNLQLSMLQMMLKRYLILCARIYKTQEQYPKDSYETDLIRNYNFLVEQHFKTKHHVIAYAELLHKSPKTLSNVFSKIGGKSPLQYIQDRLLLEARKLLRYSDQSIKEIAYDLGYKDIQTFSRFFKAQEGLSPSKYREQQNLGINANTAGITT